MPDDFPVKGLPEGVVFTGDFNPTGPNDFELIRTGGDVAIYKGVRFGQAASAVKVTPAPGWTFVQVGFEPLWDIKAGKPKDGRPKFEASKMIAPRTLTVKVVLTVDNEYHLEKAEEAIKGIPLIPGYVSSEVDG